MDLIYNVGAWSSMRDIFVCPWKEELSLCVFVCVCVCVCFFFFFSLLVVG